MTLFIGYIDVCLEQLADGLADMATDELKMSNVSIDAAMEEF
jgi:hypothetical protein